MKSVTISCKCGRKHRLYLDEDGKLQRETIEPEKENEDPKPKEKKDKSILDVIFND